MRTKTNFCTILGLLTMVGCARPFTSTKIETDQIEDAIYYALPRTTIIVEASLEKLETSTPKCVAVSKAAKAEEAERTATPPPAASKKHRDAEPEPLYRRYAAAGLDLDELPTEAGVGVVVGQSKLAMSTGARPDPNKIYAIQLEGKAGHERKLALELGIDSVLAGGSVSAENHTGELTAKVVVDTLAAVAKIVGSLFGGPVIERYHDYENLQEWKTCSAALDRLATLAEKRRRMVDGTTSLANIGDYVRLLDAERLLLQLLFSGEKKLLTGRIRCVVDPSDPAAPPTGTISDTKLWALHKTEGLVIADPSTCVATAEFVTSAPKTPGREFGLRISTKHDVNAHAAKVHANRAESGSDALIHYRVSGQASVALVEGASSYVLGPDTMTIAQYGVTMALPVPEGNKRVEAGYRIDPKTGALVKVEVKLGGKPEVPDIGKLGDAVNTVVTTAKDESTTTQDEVVQQLLLDACEASLKAGEISAACELL